MNLSDTVAEGGEWSLVHSKSRSESSAREGLHSWIKLIIFKDFSVCFIFCFLYFQVIIIEQCNDLDSDIHIQKGRNKICLKVGRKPVTNVQLQENLKT